MSKRIKMFLWEITPRIHNLPQCWYIFWLGNEWVIPKQ